MPNAMTTVADILPSWNTAVFRFTVFSTAEYKLGEVQQWWKAIAGSPERDASSQNLGKVLQVAGSTADYMGQIIVQNRQRVDFVFKEPMGTQGGVVGGLGKWSVVRALADKVVNVAVSNLGNVKRVAYAPELVRESTALESVRVIRAYMGGISESWDSTDELSLNINLHRNYSGPGGRINRVVSISIAKVIWGIPVTGGTVEVDLETHKDQKPITRLTIDVNNRQATDDMSVEELKTVSQTCVQFANQFIEQGVRT